MSQTAASEKVAAHGSANAVAITGDQPRAGRRHGVYLRIGKLTQTERRVLYVMADPRNWRVESAKDLSALAGVTIKQFRRVRASPGFQEALNEITLRRCGDKMARIMEACVQTAMIVGKEGYNDRRMLMELFGLYTPSRKVNHTGQVDVRHGVGAQLTKALESARALELEAEEVADNDQFAVQGDDEVSDAEFQD